MSDPKQQQSPLQNINELRMFGSWARLRALEMELLAIEPVGWSEQAAQAIELANDPSASESDKGVAASLARAQWEASPQRQASVKALARMLALPGRDAQGRWTLYRPLKRDSLAIDPKSGSALVSLLIHDRPEGGPTPDDRPLRDEQSHRAYSLTRWAQMAKDDAAAFFNYEGTSLAIAARNHFERLMGPAAGLTRAAPRSPAFEREPSQRELARSFAWNGSRLKSGVFAKAFKRLAFKRLVDQGGLTGLGMSATQALRSNEWPNEWVQAARDLDKGRSTDRALMLGMIRSACAKAASGELPRGEEGLACLLLASFGPGVDPRLAASQDRLWELWWGPQASGFEQFGRPDLKRIQSWRPFVDASASPWRLLAAKAGSAQSESMSSSRHPRESMSLLSSMAEGLAIEAVGEAALAEAQWLRLAGLDRASRALLQEKESQRADALGASLAVEEAQALAARESSVSGALRLILAASASRQNGRLREEVAQSERDKVFAILGLGREQLSALEKSPWGEQFAACARKALELGRAQAPQGQPMIHFAACNAALCGFLALSEQSLLRPAALSDGQVESVARAMLQKPDSAFDFHPKQLKLEVPDEMKALMDSAQALSFFADKAKETRSQAKEMGLDFLGQALQEPSLRVDPSRLAGQAQPSSKIDGVNLPLAWEGESRWAGHQEAIERRDRELHGEIKARGESYRAGFGPRHAGQGHDFDELVDELKRGSRSPDGYGVLREFMHDFMMFEEEFFDRAEEREEFGPFGRGGRWMDRDAFAKDWLARRNPQKQEEQAKDELSQLLLAEGMAGKMALLAMQAQRKPDMREDADARSRANAWLGEAKLAAKEWLGLSEGGWRLAMGDEVAGGEALRLARQAVSGRLMMDSQLFGRFLNHAASCGRPAKGAAWAARAACRGGMAAGDWGVRDIDWRAFAQRCAGGVLPEVAYREAAAECETARALRPRWMDALIERSAQLEQELAAKEPLPQEAPRDRHPRHGLWGRGEREGGEGVGEAVVSKLRSEIGDMLDWARDREGRFYSQLPPKFTWKTLAEGSKLWHDEAIRRKASNQTWEPIGIRWEGSGELAGWTARELTTGVQLAEEGAAMRHCVGSYASKCVNGSSRIVSIMFEGRRVSTLELSTDKPSSQGRLDPVERSWSVVQHRAVCNAEPAQKALMAEREVRQAAIAASREAFELEAKREPATQEKEVKKVDEALLAAQSDFQEWDEASGEQPPEALALREKLRERAEALATRKAAEAARLASKR